MNASPPAASSPRLSRPTVVVVALNDRRTQAYVLASALAIATRADVTVLRPSVDGARLESAYGLVRLVDVAIDVPLTDQAIDARTRRRVAVLPVRIVDRAAGVAWRAFDRARSRIAMVGRSPEGRQEAEALDHVLAREIDALAPDVIHAHGVVVALAASRASARLVRSGRATPWIFDVGHWPLGLPTPGARSPRELAGWRTLERSLVAGAARVVSSQPVGREVSLQDAYADVAGFEVGSVTLGGDADPGVAVGTIAAQVLPSPIRIGVGPANSAGQGWAWADAAARLIPDVTHEVIAIDSGRFAYPCDVSVSARRYARDATWADRVTERALAQWTHAIFEAGRPILGTRHGRDFRGDEGVLRAAGIRTALAFHGSEIRDPRRHVLTHQYSPFQDVGDPMTRTLQAKVDALLPLIAAFGGPIFVSTPDLLDYLPNAAWLPVVVDARGWPSPRPLWSRPIPLVVHAPSNAALKGTRDVEQVLTPLANRGLIEYRRIEGVAQSEVARVVADADVVVDQLLLGLYGVLACEGMALGRVVVGNVGDTLRSRVPTEVPVIEADPSTLAAVIAEILDSRSDAASHAADGPAFVTEWHDGRRSAQALEAFLSEPGRT